MRIKLRNYQENDINRIRLSYRAGNRGVLYTLPTGGGKTVIFTYIAESAIKKNKRVMILVHRQELLRQTSEHLEKLGVPHGLIAPGHSMTGDRVQVASVQALIRRLDRVNPPDIIIIDEAHHSIAGSWRKVIDKFPDAHLLGVTATPWRLSGAGLGVNAGGYFNDMIIGPTIQDLIARGFLSQPIVYAPPSPLDLSGIKRNAGDYAKKELALRMDKPTITGNAVEHYLRICPDAPAVAFCASIKHAIHVAEEFNAAGVPSAALAGKDLTDLTRKYRIDALSTGKIKVLTSCEIISEGTDIPVITAAILLRPTYSLGLYLQQVGRALRVHPGKTNAIILDHVGNSLKHGLPDQIRRWTLEGQPKKTKKQLEEIAESCRQCESCYAVYQSFLKVCPQCGFEFKIKERKIDEVEGELKRLTPEEVKVVQEKKAKRKEVGRADSLEALQAIAKERGYKPGWATYYWHQIKKKKRSKNKIIRDNVAFQIGVNL